MTKIRSVLVLGPSLALLAVPAHAAPTPSATPTPTATASRRASPSPSASPRTPSASPTPSASVTPTPVASPSATPPPATPQALSPIQQKWTELGGDASPVGKPTGPEVDGGRGSRYQQFEHGRIYWRNDIGAQWVCGLNFERYRALGFENGIMGLPLTGEIAGQDRDSRLNRYESGTIIYHRRSGSHEIHGMIRDKWLELGGERTVGTPSTDEFLGNDRESRLSWIAEPNGGTRTIAWHQRHGAHSVQGAIRDKWHSLGAEGGFGRPTTDEFKGNDNGRARLNWFAEPSGAVRSIVWTPTTGAHVVQGAIRDLWHSMSAEGGTLGAPTTDEYAGANGTQVSRFERGRIVWTPHHGAHAVFGALGDEYTRRGAEGGDLGVPTSGEWSFDGGWAQEFTNARLLFLRDGRYVTQVRVNAYVRQAHAGDVSRTYRAGCPVGPDQLRVVEMNHLGYDGRVYRGMIVLRADAVDRTVRAFSSASWNAFPIFRMTNPDVWGNDPDQMEANNTSGFFCRSVVGNPYAMSPHSYGRAVDVNTVQNPYFDGRRWWPSAGTPWIDRSRRDQGMLFDGGLMTKDLVDNGYFWGGWWASKDYHHFEIK